MNAAVSMDEEDDDDGVSLLEMLVPLALAWRTIVIVSLLAGLLTYAATYLITPTYVAKTVILPPQQQQSSAASALAQLGALTGVAGAGISTRNSVDQYVALMQSDTVTGSIIQRFDLMRHYEAKFLSDARKELLSRSLISAGKKDGLISVSIEDEDPKRAVAMADRYVEELRLLTNRLALSEAQQRRAFFEAQLQSTRDRLTQAQLSLQASGFSTGALRAEPRAAAEGYARLRAEVTAAEVRLSTLRNGLAETTPEVQTQQATVNALRGQLARLEASTDNRPGGNAADVDYVTRYREFKYQETLFDLFSRQYEIARLDEAREGALIQVIDPAQAPDRRNKPKRVLIALGATFGVALVLMVWILVRHGWRAAAAQPDSGPARLRRALAGA